MRGGAQKVAEMSDSYIPFCSRMGTSERPIHNGRAPWLGRREFRN